MRWLLISLILISLAPGTTQPDAELPARIQQAAAHYRNKDGFMGVVAMSRDHHLVYESGYGYANVGLKIPFGRDTRFAIGSLSKQFTAAAILLLKENGKLKTSDRIGLYYRDAPAAWGGITIRNLLAQTSGIPDFDFGRIHRDNLQGTDELLNEAMKKTLEFEPGAKFEYANVNYLLLSKVVERASGKPFCEFLRDRIFRPLELKQTGCVWKMRIAGSAHGYHPSPHGPVDFEDDDLVSLEGAGSMYSSADDLIRWTEALHGGRVLSKSSLTEMTTPGVGHYGYGLGVDGEGAEVDISHNGVVDGFFACLDYLPATRTTVVVLSNLVAEGNQDTPGTLALDTEIVRLGLNENASLPSEGKEAQVSEEILRGYAGKYRSADANPVDITLTFRDRRLSIQNGEGAAVPIYAESKTRFYLKNQGTELVFDGNIAGRFEFLNYSPIGGAVFDRVPVAMK